MKNRPWLLWLLPLLFTWSSCAQKLGAGFTAGIKKELPPAYLDSTAQTLSRTVARTIMATVLNDSIQARLRLQLDSVARQLDQQALTTTVKVRDSLLSAYTQKWLEGVIEQTSRNLNAQGLAFLNNIRGDQTRLFVGSLRDELLNEITLQRAAVFRDELLGRTTHNLIDSLVQQIATGLIQKQVNPGLARINAQTEKKITQFRRIAYVAGAVALFIALVAIWFFRQARKHRETLKVITRQIDKIPNQAAYDNLVSAIKTEASTKGLEPHLQQILKEDNLYQQPQWQNKDYQTLQVITQYLNRVGQTDPGQEILHGLQAESQKVNLDEHLNSLLQRNGHVAAKVN